MWVHNIVLYGIWILDRVKLNRTSDSTYWGYLWNTWSSMYFELTILLFSTFNNSAIHSHLKPHDLGCPLHSFPSNKHQYKSNIAFNVAYTPIDQKLHWQSILHIQSSHHFCNYLTFSTIPDISLYDPFYLHYFVQLIQPKSILQTSSNYYIQLKQVRQGLFVKWTLQIWYLIK